MLLYNFTRNKLFKVATCYYIKKRPSKGGSKI